MNEKEKKRKKLVKKTWTPWQERHWKAIWVTSGLMLPALTTVPWTHTSFPGNTIIADEKRQLNTPVVYRRAKPLRSSVG